MNRSLLILTVNKFMSNVTNETNASKQSFPKELTRKYLPHKQEGPG